MFVLHTSTFLPSCEMQCATHNDFSAPALFAKNNETEDTQAQAVRLNIFSWFNFHT